MTQCEATSYKYGRVPDLASARSYEGRYGPGGYNRCVETKPHEIHTDDFGNRWVIDGQTFHMVERANGDQE